MRKRNNCEQQRRNAAIGLVIHRILPQQYLTVPVWLPIFLRAHLINPHGREADSAGWAARHEECDVVIPPERRVTPQYARRVASLLKKSDVRIRFAVPAFEWGFGAHQ